MLLSFYVQNHTAAKSQNLIGTTMEILVKQKRGQLSGYGRDKRDESSVFRERKGVTMPKEDKKESSISQFPRLMNQDYDTMNFDFATAVAASAFAIHSKEEAELQYQKNIRESFDHTSGNRTRTTKDNEITITNMPNTAGREITKRLSNKETNKAGSMKKQFGQDHKTLSERTTSLSNLPSGTSSVRPTTRANKDQRQKGTSTGRSSEDTKADAWEKTQMEKIQKRYEKIKSDIITWESEKKKQAKFKMERRKNIIEERRTQNLQHYNNKLTRIDEIVRGARALLEEKIKNEESGVKEKAKKIRSTNQVPLKCFCFRCYSY